jgi:hypothetical protein
VSDLDVVYVNPEFGHRAALDAVKAIADEGNHQVPWNIHLRIIIGELIHPLGIHHWVTLRVWDPASSRILATGKKVCRVDGCHRARV